jgi:cell division protein FtsI (penicillin-binding protein 3)
MTAEGNVELESRYFEPEGIPDVVGMGASDAVFILENRGLKVSFKGQGKVSSQSIKAGAQLKKGQRIVLTLS